MNLSLALKRPFIWLSRIGHRRGYGVHSPSAFHFITRVVYERTPYYRYKDLAAEQRRLAREQGRAWAGAESRKLKRLLFRIVNHVCPQTVIDAGTPSAAALYLRAARTGADYTAASDLSELFLESGVPVDFLYLHDYRRPDFVEKVFRVCAPRTTPRSAFVIHGIRYSRPMRDLWLRMRQDERVGVTFDLYDVGVLFFDRSKNKEHYIVNF